MDRPEQNHFAYLANVTLASLVDKQRAKETAVVQDRRRVAAHAGWRRARLVTHHCPRWRIC